MLWAIVSVACVGILLGLWLRVASVIAASLILAVVSTPLLPLFTEWSLLKAVGFLFALLSALQCGYLVGAVIACSQMRSRSPANIDLQPVRRPGRNQLPRVR
jgi:hypothetical protein